MNVLILKLIILLKDLEFFNNSHTVEVGFLEADSTNRVIRNNNEVFELLQFHFHTPSEHTVDGRHYDMEVHFVNSRLEDDSDPLSLLVVGVFVDAQDDDEECSFLNQFLNDLPEDVDDDEEVDIEVLLDFDDDTEFFTYSGSLTTPPCTEIVNWVVKVEPIRCARSQVEEFSDIIGESNRPTLSRNSRDV